MNALPSCIFLGIRERCGTLWTHGLGFLLLTRLLLPVPDSGAAELPHGLETRLPWTTSRVVGSPDPPLAYTTEPMFTNLTWKTPLYLVAEPGTRMLLVVLQGGEADRPSRILRLEDDPDVSRVETLLEMQDRLLYGLAFHPGYVTNGHLFVFSNGPTGASARTQRRLIYIWATPS
jgi:hypothetical protein